MTWLTVFHREFRWRELLVGSKVETRPEFLPVGIRCVRVERSASGYSRVTYGSLSLFVRAFQREIKHRLSFVVLMLARGIERVGRALCNVIDVVNENGFPLIGNVTRD